MRLSRCAIVTGVQTCSLPIYATLHQPPVHYHAFRLEMLRHQPEVVIDVGLSERRFLVDLKMQHLRDSRGRSDRQGHALGEDRGSRNTQMTGAELRQTGPGAARIDGDRLHVDRKSVV